MPDAFTPYFRALAAIIFFAARFIRAPIFDTLDLIVDAPRCLRFFDIASFSRYAFLMMLRAAFRCPLSCLFA